MWWRAVLVFSLVIIDNISAQDDKNATETQTKMCCPCPPGWPGVPVDAAMALAPGPMARGADGVDDCPCRARDADSEGAASLFFPHSVRAPGNVMRPDSKEDSKPLLHPEVDLASSVLQTLREATDEEYRDALERDAARAAVDVTTLADLTDGAPEEARNVVTIIVSPRDMDDSDAVPEASHVQETRCIHSLLGNPRALTYRAPVPHKGLEDILNLPLPGGMLHRQRDSGLAASNVHESVVRAEDNLNKLLSGLKLKAEPSLLNLDPKTLSENLNKILSGENSGINAGSNSLDRSEVDNSDAYTDSSNDQISSEVVQENNVVTENDSDGQSVGQDDLDCNTSPTTNRDTVLEKSAKDARPLKSLLFARNNGEKPEVSFPLKNVLKLKDVELVPLTIMNNKPKTKVNIPRIKLDPLQKIEARDSVKLPTRVLFGRPSKIATGLNKFNKAKSANIQIIPKRKPVTTEILDVVPSPSEDNCVRLKPEADKSVVDMEQLEESLLESDTAESGNEQADDLIAKSTDTASIDSAEDVQLTSSEILEDEEVDDTEDFQIIDDTQIPVQESESDIQIISQENISDVAPDSVDLSEINEAEDRSHTVPVTLPPPKTLEQIRKNVVDKLENLQKSNRYALDSIKHNVDEISPRVDSVEGPNHVTDVVENEDQISIVDPTFKSPTPESPIEDKLQEASVSTESVSFQDLQKMSDSILMASENHEQRAQHQPEGSLESKEDTISEEINESEIDNVLGMDATEANPKDDLSQSSDGSDKIEKILCPSDLSKSSEQAKSEASSSKNDISTGNDLEPLASDPIMDILRPTSLTGEPIINILRPNSKSIVEHLNDFGTKLRQSIVQPAPLINADDFNIFRAPSLNLPDISGLNANIPTLDDIRTRVSEILYGLARSAGDDNDSSEFDSEDFSSNVNPVQSAGASSSDPVSIFPPLKPLEDINLDIIQLKPLPSLLGSSSQIADLPGLNLNRYKAKLAIPKSLDLKPLNLASTLGNNGGLVGTTLTIGPQKKEKTGKPKVKSNKNAEYVSSRGALSNNPTLADITSTMHKNALNLLNISKNTKSSILEGNNLMGDLAEKIRTHTEDTVKSIHETINPSALADVQNNVLKSANNLLASGRSSLHKSLQKPIHSDSAVDNFRSQTQNTIKQLHNTLSSTQVASDIRKNAKSILKSPKSSLDAVVDNLKHQSENTIKNVKQTLDTSRLADISDSIRKSAENVLKSSVAITPSRNAVPTIDEVAGNLRSHTQSTLKNIHQTLNAPTLSDISTSIQKSAQQVLNSPVTNSRSQILKNALQPSTSIDTVVDNLRSQTQNTMRNIQSSLNAPSLADISATVQKHAQNLLDSPVASTGRDAFKQVLQASSSINLTPHADQVAKDLHRTVKATLKNSPIKDLPPLPHPNDVIQTISDHHSDMNDKLYALHMDFNDRLESIHNEVTDPARLRSILSPPGNRNFELFAIPLPMSSRIASAPKKARPVLRSKQPALASQRKPSTTASTLSQPRMKPGKQSFMRASKGNKNPPKSFRIPSAASSPIPTHVERPTLSLSPKKPIKLQDLKMPALPKLKPLSKNKVTITFGSTTQRSPLVGKSKATPTTAKPKVPTNNRFKPKPLVRQPTPWIGKGEARNAPKRLGEPLTSPSRTAASLKTPLKAKPAKPVSKQMKTETSSRSSPVPPKFKSQSSIKPLKTSLTKGRASARASALSQLNQDKPKSPLLTKLTESLKSKNLGKSSQIPRARNQDEMAPAASERLEKAVALEEPMKENTAYKCKMMCVKVDLNEDNRRR